MKVLFMIPKNDPPALDGNFSPKLVDFVAQCLRKDPQDRPTALELLQHPFIRSSKHISNLTELLERSQLDDVGANTERDAASAAGYHNGQNCYTPSLERTPSIGRGWDSKAPTGSSSMHSSKDSSDSRFSIDSNDESSKCHGRSRPSPVDSGWDFNTVRLTSSAGHSHADTSKTTSLSAVGLPPSYDKSVRGGSNLSKDWGGIVGAGLADSGTTMSSSVVSGLDSSSDMGDVEGSFHESGSDGPDAEVFASIVKPAIFEVLDRVVSARTAAESLPSRFAREEALAAAELKEELLFEFLHAFDSLTQQRGLLTEVLASVVEFANAISATNNSEGRSSSDTSPANIPHVSSLARSPDTKSTGTLTITEPSRHSSNVVSSTVSKTSSTSSSASAAKPSAASTPKPSALPVSTASIPTALRPSAAAVPVSTSRNSAACTGTAIPKPSAIPFSMKGVAAAPKSAPAAVSATSSAASRPHVSFSSTSTSQRVSGQYQPLDSPPQTRKSPGK
jgi:serine/threonine protein kinase